MALDLVSIELLLLHSPKCGKTTPTFVNNAKNVAQSNGSYLNCVFSLMKSKMC